ncbi:hypothetical protein D187_000857 [Cystobacter fuscus DSM 2262]|uniref:Uncharacterized protein n=1 Tax=Cystobacter fuscus (strain ATCC 25194 / DSM 2262 / NBRC 100088 / M29) TaxID=1242864 RepID=S9QII3_CYSF2|nr:hypothetical protein D187_000857 [Cystobacter fuscus DSM 2262]
MKFELIDARKALFPVNFMCEQLGVSRSGYSSPVHWRRALFFGQRVEQLPVRSARPERLPDRLDRLTLIKVLTPPTGSFDTRDAKVTCTWKGTATVNAREVASVTKEWPRLRAWSAGDQRRRGYCAPATTPLSVKA